MSDGLNREGFTEPQADEIPDVYARYIRATFPPEVLVNAPNEIAGRWRHTTGSTEREFWRSLDALDRLAPQPAPELAEPALVLADGEVIATRAYGGGAIVISFAPGAPLDRAAELRDAMAAQCDVPVFAVADVAAIRAWEPHEIPARELAAAMGESRRALDRLAAIRDLCQKRLRVVGMVDGKGVARKIIAIIDKPEA